MDETAFLAEFYKEYNPKGLEIVGLAFERTSDYTEAKATIE